MNLLLDGAKELGLPLSPDEARQFELYLSDLLKWNAKVNLTAVTQPNEIVVKHFLDSLALLRILPVSPRFTACDIGSGAGFPGLALKVVMPGMELTLVEPIHKKAAFLRQVSRTMGLTGVTVLEARAEDLLDKISSPFDIVFSRAFKAPAELLPLAAPVLKDGGHAALSLGSGTGYNSQPGWTVEREEDITLPFSDIKRKLILLKKS